MPGIDDILAKYENPQPVNSGIDSILAKYEQPKPLPDNTPMGALKAALPMAARVAGVTGQVPLTPNNPLVTPEARGVGQGVIQGATLGYGMPALRKVIPDSSQVPQPTPKEEMVGTSLSLPVGGAEMGAVMKGAGKLAPLVPAAMGYATNPSNTNIEPIISGKRALDAGMAGLTQLGVAGASKIMGRINPDAVQALTRALKPNKNNKTFNDSAAVALPIIKQTGVPVDTVEDFTKAANAAKKTVWGKIKDIFTKAGGNEIKSPDYSDVKNTATQIMKDELDNYNQSNSFVEQVKNISGGGIRPYKKSLLSGQRPEMDEYVNDIPNKFKNSKGMPLDEVVQNYNETFGTNFDENSFVRELKSFDGVAKPSVNYKDYMNDAIKNHQEYFHDSLMEGDKVANEMIKSIPPESVKLSANMGNAVSDVADSYRGKMISIPEMEDRLQSVNAKLTGYFKSPMRGQNVKEEQETVFAMLQERKIIRQILNDKIEGLTGESIAPLKKQYGALMNVQDEALGRVNVANRQAPVSLQEAINGVAGITELFDGNPLGLVRIGASEVVKKLNSSNYLVKKAVENTGRSPFAGNVAKNISRAAGSVVPATIQRLLSQKYRIGQTITAPDGRKGIVTDFDETGHPLVQQVQ